MKLGVVGMGYVGIPEAVLFAGLPDFEIVYGFQRESDTSGYKIKLLNEGKLPFQEEDLEIALEESIKNHKFVCTSDYSKLSECNTIIVAVQTPPDLKAFFEAVDIISNSVSEELSPLVVVVSTVPPGTIAKIKEKFNGKNIRVTHAPERVMPKKLIYNLQTLPRIIGGDCKEDINATVDLYRKIYVSDFIRMSCIEAEITKTSENAIRAVQIAVANQIAVVCENNGANFFKVKEGIDSLKGKGITRALLLPGAGVGGHCLTKDGYLLMRNERESPDIFSDAIFINNLMPYHMWQLTKNALREHTTKSIGESRVLVFGWSYLPNTSDDRDSPSASFKRLAEREGCSVIIHDPLCGYDNINEIIRVDAIVIMTMHDIFEDIIKLLPNSEYPYPKILIDGRNVVANPNKLIKAGWVYKAIGRGDL